MASLVYWNPTIYSTTMRMLYGSHFHARYKAIDELIPEKADIVEICMGDGYLYKHYLKKKNVNYQGLDINPVFIRNAQSNGINAKIFDLNKDKIPTADIIIMQASLYQFMPDHETVLKRLIQAANKTVIIAEPIRNLADSDVPVISLLAKYAADPGTGHAVKRLDKNALDQLFSTIPEHKKSFVIEGGRELIGIFQK